MLYYKPDFLGSGASVDAVEFCHCPAGYEGSSCQVIYFYFYFIYLHIQLQCIHIYMNNNWIVSFKITSIL